MQEMWLTGGYETQNLICLQDAEAVINRGYQELMENTNPLLSLSLLAR